MRQSTDEKRSDVPLSAALLLLVVVAFAVFVGPDAFKYFDEAFALEGAFEDNLIYFATALVTGALSFAWITSQFQRTFRLTKQGSRLKSLLGEKDQSSSCVFCKVATSAFVSGAAFTACLLATRVERMPLILSDFQYVFWSCVQFSAAAMMGLSAFVFTLAVYRPIRERFLSWAESRVSLPEFPKIPNTVTMGTVNEEDSDDAPQWVTLDRRALNGNVLVTGSIGSGKTQGTILTYFDQALKNFNPCPSVLAVDPKGSFIAEARKIIKSHGLSQRTLHLSLGGEVFFNPIYDPDALKSARYLDIAYMIQAAGANFLGRSSDSVFWESHSFNLIRHSLAYCAASLHYYTFLDLYDAILRAIGNELPEKIKEVLETKALDTEERFNLTRAFDYFSLEFGALEERVRTSILATATAFLNQFQEYQASRIFCPAEKTPRLRSMDDVIDSGQILLLDIASPALAKSMGTVIKLLYQQSLLDRLKDTRRGKATCSLILVDEYQDVVTTSNGTSIGDDRFLAKAREANAITVVATQSLASLNDAIGKEASAKSLVQCFRTRIAGHSSDLVTIREFQELAGEVERKRVSHSVAELSQDTKKNHLLGGFEANSANISESVSTSVQKERLITGKEFSTLSSFEAFALIYDGVHSHFKKLFLKPYFLKEKAVLHVDVLKGMATAACVLTLYCGFFSKEASAFPNICDVVNTPDFSSCLEFSVSGCVCGYPPRPCAQFNYYVPTSFVEVHPNAGETFFGGLPAARAQLSSLPNNRLPYGAEADNDTQSFQARTLSIPLASTVLGRLPCGTSASETTCFEAMSEHLGTNWTTGVPDQQQPQFLAWMASPKACLLAGAATSITGGIGGTFGGGNAMCSVPMSLSYYPPSAHFACNGWGVFYPRVGVYNGPSQTAGALMVAARIKSLASEVFQSTPSSPSEKWQTISPQASACFLEGENILPLETFKRATELGRLGGGPLKGHLFAIWQPASCCRELSEIPSSAAILAALKAACAAGGDL